MPTENGKLKPIETLTKSGYGIYTSRDNAVTLCKRDYNLGGSNKFLILFTHRV